MQRRFARVAAGLAVLAVLASGATAHGAPSGIERGLEQTEQERQRAEERLAERRAEEGDARSRLETAQAEHGRAQAALTEIEAALAAATAARDAATARAEELRAELAVAQAELAETEAELDEVQRRFDARIAGAYKRGSTRAETAVVGHLLAQDSIADALATAPFLTAVIDADRRTVDELNEALSEVEQQRATAARLRVDAEREAEAAARAAREVSEQVAAAEAATAELAAVRAELDAAHEAIVEDRRAVESHLASIEAESARLEGELRAIAEQRAREAREREAAERRAREREQAERDAANDGGDDGDQSTGDDDGGNGGSGDGNGNGNGGGETTPPPSTGSWQWPAACQRVTSHYGSRWGRMHQGVDIACTRVLGPNPPIYASRGGVIAPVSCGSGYGICVIVDHLDGDFTLYAHMSGLAVGSGASVSAGQVIGYEGSTGNSTGPHLHFELWKSGTKTNPCPYIGC